MSSLGAMVFRRLALGALTLLLVATMIFVATDLLPGDAATAILGQNATPESLAVLRERLGLDAPVHVRYFSWLAHALSGDLGVSFGTSMPVVPLLADRMWNTLRLAGLAAVMSMPVAFLLGVGSAVRAGSAFDRGTGVLALVVISVPEFFLGLVLVFLFAVQLGMFPAFAVVRPGQDSAAFLRSIFLPALTLALAMAPHIIRMTRSAIMSGLTSSYVETAVLKGLPRATIVWRHVLPNALGSLISISALILAYFVAGVVVVETAFAFSGIGRLMVDAVATKDTPLIQGCALVLAGVYVVMNTLADLAAMLVNPRLRDSP
jgi:peptide/nickel transport system permease protein